MGCTELKRRKCDVVLACTNAQYPLDLSFKFSCKIIRHTEKEQKKSFYFSPRQ